jgi:hypothetical protein
MRNLFLVTAGFLCAAAGLVFLPLPTPFGVPLLLTGAALILAGSAIARQHMQRFRSSNARSHRWLAAAEGYLPRFLRLPLRRTHPRRGRAGQPRAHTSRNGVQIT